MKNDEKRLSGIVLLFLAFVATVLLLNSVSKKPDAGDSSVVIGGKLENGYESAGFLIAQEDSISANVCGAVLIDNITAVTAAHCFTNTNKYYFGTHEFTNKEENLNNFTHVLFHPEWDRTLDWSQEKSAYDVAYITLNQPVSNISNFAEIASPLRGCNYEVVGYGQTGTDMQENIRLRKSSEICITEITSSNFLIKGSGGGICSGDSGSPIFLKGTNKVVGILSAAETLGATSSINCSENNIGLAVRIDTNINLINEPQNISLQTNGLSCGLMDFDLDLQISNKDFFDFTKYYSKTCLMEDLNESPCGKKDSNSDGKIDIKDFSRFIELYINKSCV